MDIYSFFLAMSILKVSDAVFRFQCPVQSHWTHRAGTICGSKSSYFCLYDINENNFTEFCRKNPDFEKPGKKLIVAGSTQGTLQGSNCSNDFYQPLKFWTNESHSCVLAKSYCNEEGQVVYRNETNKVDRSCRCDYTRGYDFIIRPKHRCYCVPSEEDCSCHLKICPSNYNFSQDYECIKVTERNTRFNCESIHSVVLPKNPEISLSTTSSLLESYVLAYKNARVAVQGVVKWTLAASILSVLAVLGIFCFLRKKCKGTEIDENLATWKAIEQSTSEKQIEEIDIEAQELEQGGEGGVGLVKALETWGKDSYRGAVKISWKADNLVKNYRVGGEGCVDVIYTRMTETASGGNYYADHLPFVDVVNPGQILLKIGDKVVITLPLKGFRQLQDNQAYGGWDDDMNQCLEETGTIVGFLYNGMSVKVQYEDSKTWVINKVALTRKHTFTQGDAVTILDNYNAVKELQKGHGGWNDEMKTALGKNGRIVRLDSDGDMRIKIGDKTWIFNPACIMPIDDASTAKSIPVLSRQDTRDHSDDESETGSEGDEGGQG